MVKNNPGEPYSRISSEEAFEMQQSGNSMVVDVRNQDEYESGHVSGAKLIPVDDLLGRIDELPTDKKLFFICAAGVRSGLACEMAASMGINPENLYNIEEGTPTWIENGYPTDYGNEK